MNVLSIVGSVAFAASGAIVAMDEDYDIFGILVLGFITAFAGGMMRNLIVGIPVAAVWHQTGAFIAVLAALGITLVVPGRLLKWGWKLMVYFDALGLSTFAVEGALYAERIHVSAGTVMVAAAMTGAGGGVIRDLLAQRKPLILRSDTYAIWALLAGAVIGLRWVSPHVAWQVYVVLAGTFVLRVLSIVFHWHLPHVESPNRDKAQAVDK
nr:trimeric intracellular cation channel family protein [Sulfobacillus harzensis]